MVMPALPVGVHGKVTCTRSANGVWQARTHLRDYDGELRQVKASGHTKGVAERNLTSKLAERVRLAGSGELAPTDTVLSLRAFWLADLAKAVEEDARRPQTLRTYGRNLDPLMTLMGAMRLRDVTPAIVDTRIKELPSRDMRQKSRSHLVRMFDVAVLHNAVAFNPVLSTTRYKKKSKHTDDIEVMTDEMVAAARAAVAAWCSRSRPGPKSTWFADLFDLLIATGCRINEVLAIQWPDVDLSGAVPTVAITGTLVDLVDSTGAHRIIRQDRPKSGRGERMFVLPAFAASMLRRRKLAEPSNDLDAVFATRNGTWRQDSNVGRIWRHVRAEADLEWVTFHTFRRTVGTAVADAYGPAAAAGQLGNTVDVAEGYYIKTTRRVVDVSDVMQQRWSPTAGRD